MATRINISRGSWSRPASVRKIYQTVQRIVSSTPKSTGKRPGQSTAVAKALNISAPKARGLITQVRSGQFQPTIKGAIVRFQDNSQVFIGGRTERVAVASFGKLVERYRVNQTNIGPLAPDAKNFFSPKEIQQARATLATYEQAFSELKKTFGEPDNSTRALVIRLVEGSGSKLKGRSAPNAGRRLADNIVPSSVRHYYDGKRKNALYG